MDRHIIIPLEQDFEKIEIRVSNLEQYYSCAYKFKNEEKKCSNNEALLLGNCINSVIQTSLYNDKKGTEVINILCKNFPDRCEYFHRCKNLIQEYKSKHTIITNEMKIIAEIELGRYLVILEGTIDILFKSKETGGYILADLKTSKGERTEDVYRWKIQKYMYSWLFSKMEPVERFDYLIMTKHALPNVKRKNNPGPRLQVISYVPDSKELADFVDNILINYVESVITEEYKTNKIVDELGSVNPACWYCDLKKSGLCPARQEKSFIPY